MTVHLPDPISGEDRVLLVGVVERNQRKSQCGLYIVSPILLDNPKCFIAVFVTLSRQHFAQRPYSVSDIRATLADLVGFQENEVVAPWFFKLLDLLEDHEDACDPFYSDVFFGSATWVKYHFAGRGVLPSNYVAVGDANMTLNPMGCES